MSQASVKAAGRYMNLRLLSATVALVAVPQAVRATEIIATSGDWEIFRDSKSCEKLFKMYL